MQPWQSLWKVLLMCKTFGEERRGEEIRKK